MTILDDLAAEVVALTQAVRPATADPADQIRLLSKLATFGLDTNIPLGTDPIGIAGYRNAGPGQRWYGTARSTVATYFDADGVLRTAPPGMVRPAFSNGALTGHLDEPTATNLRLNSCNILLNGAPDTYYIGANAIDQGMVTAPDGTLTARCVKSGPSGPGNVYLANAAGTAGMIAVSPNTTYTASIYLRDGGNTPIIACDGPTVDEFTSGLSHIGRTAYTWVGAMLKTGAYTRYSVTWTTASTCENVVVTWAANWTVNGIVDVWGAQLEAGDTATSIIYTGNSPATRAADNIVIQTVSELSTAAQASKIAEASLAALCRRAALSELALAVQDYAPASSDEASAALKRILPLYDAEIANAADRNDLDSCNELRSLRVIVTQDLQRRGMQLPEIMQVELPTSLPSLTIAQMLYGDGRRADELERRVDTPHPLFFPTRFEALSR
ncbi:hypothetical protein JYK14_01320 [Siccirubricoccus sp. KC 17139]|uniref:Baseplate protein J-like domain-containing protein n=1 Tax=Siccirubricoccus soli TaxID=2899147 RepID=A0ABT1D0K9_9PROT|nr:hypothetical protein [Siccirubricoccus soli]MCO6414820.1 hypothetical protein [Siccirubricoccus soli]MCP2680950.1 hypothetical protein [Siccirubricoccus soli]